jgi:hypothetical protein
MNVSGGALGVTNERSRWRRSAPFPTCTFLVKFLLVNGANLLVQLADVFLLDVDVAALSHSRLLS